MIALPYHWPQPPSGVWTLRDVERLPEDSRVEVIDGVLTVAPLPLPIHQRLGRRIINAIEQQLPGRWQIEGPLDVMLNLDPLNYLAPDAVVFGADVPLDARPIPVEDVVLVVEVVSPGSRRRDRTTKPVVYAEAGLPHFWRVEGATGRDGLTVHVFGDPDDGNYQVEQVFTGRLSTPVPFPIEIDLEKLS